MDDGVCIQYHPDSNVFNLWQLSAHSKTSSTVVFELQYADDASAVSPCPIGLQRIIKSLHTAHSKMGQEINITKKMTLQTAFHQNKLPTVITIKNAPLENTNSFNYLGSIISSDASVTEEVTNRVK